MSSIVLSRVAQKALLTARLTAVPFIAGHLKLFNNNITPNQNSVLADFTEPTFTGYASALITWGTVIYDSNGIPVGPTNTTYALTSGTGDTCYGCFYIDSTGALQWSSVFDGGPIVFVNPGDGYSIGILYGLTQGTVTVLTGP